MPAADVVSYIFFTWALGSKNASCAELGLATRGRLSGDQDRDVLRRERVEGGGEHRVVDEGGDHGAGVLIDGGT